MENLKLISVRINHETLKSLDEFSEKSRFYNRSALINGILNAVMNCADAKSIAEMCRFNAKWHDGTTIQFESKWKERK